MVYFTKLRLELDKRHSNPPSKPVYTATASQLILNSQKSYSLKVLEIHITSKSSFMITPQIKQYLL
jgi:hypothetical protein